MLKIALGVFLGVTVAFVTLGAIASYSVSTIGERLGEVDLTDSSFQ